MVRAKFRVNAVQRNSPASETVYLHPVYSGSDENKGFWEATPSGSIMMTINNPGGIGFFQDGKEYYIDFRAADQ
jgi:hypothetical protein